MKILILLVIIVPFCFAGDSLKINSSMLFGSEYKANLTFSPRTILSICDTNGNCFDMYARGDSLVTSGKLKPDKAAQIFFREFGKLSVK